MRREVAVLALIPALFACSRVEPTPPPPDPASIAANEAKERQTAQRNMAMEIARFLPVVNAPMLEQCKKDIDSPACQSFMETLLRYGMPRKPEWKWFEKIRDKDGQYRVWVYAGTGEKGSVLAYEPLDSVTAAEADATIKLVKQGKFWTDDYDLTNYDCSTGASRQSSWHVSESNVTHPWSFIYLDVMAKTFPTDTIEPGSYAEAIWRGACGEWR